MDVIYAGMLVSFYQIIYGEAQMLGGLTKTEALTFVGACLVLDGIQMTFVHDNLDTLAEKVKRGDIDYYLVRPVSPLFFLSLKELSPNSLINLCFAFGIFGYYLSELPYSISFFQLLWFAILIANGCVLYYLTRLLFILPIFWLGLVGGIDTLFYNLYYVVDRPDKVFKGAVRLVFSTLLPFCVMVSFPVRVLFEGSDPLIIAHIFGVTLVLAILVRFLWALCLRSYSSASS